MKCYPLLNLVLIWIMFVGRHKLDVLPLDKILFKANNFNILS